MLQTALVCALLFISSYCWFGISRFWLAWIVCH